MEGHEETFSYLALGDSYTIGEGISLHESFPYQTVQLLRKSGYGFHAAEIVARTGWTTDELLAAIARMKFLARYDFVSLLIGVNNQYRGRSVEEYTKQFKELLQLGISLAGEIPSHLVVLSIPDWGATPFAAGTDRKKISEEIDLLNEVTRSLSEQYKTQYIDITSANRTVCREESALAADKLHPSGREYRRWAEQISRMIVKQLELHN